MMASKESLRLAGRDLTFSRGDRRVLDGASLGVASGEIVSLLGANGAGKTTLLRLLMGFLAPQGGDVRLGGESLRGLGRRQVAQKIAYVAQSHLAPFPYRVRDVVMLGRLPHIGLFNRPGQGDEDCVDHLLERLGLSPLAGRPYTEISGGERQLTLLGRALAQGARILVMDEPMSGLDYGHQMRLIGFLRDLAAEGCGILMSTHHPDHAHWVSSRIALLIDGRIEADGAPGDVLTPAAIRWLYGVDTVAVSASGRTAFLPL